MELELENLSTRAIQVLGHDGFADACHRVFVRLLARVQDTGDPATVAEHHEALHAELRRLLREH